MEDKKTLLAFLLIGIILFAMPYYMEWIGVSPTEKPPESAETAHPAEPIPTQEQQSRFDDNTSNNTPEATIDQANVKPQQKIIDSAPLPQEPATIPSNRFIPRDIVINTPLQRLVLSTAGGVITSAQLLNYSYIGEDFVELLAPGGQGFILKLKDQESVQDLQTTEFVPNKEGINLAQGEEATLSLKVDLGAGRSIEKIFRFNADQYGLNLDIIFNGFSEDIWAYLEWEKGIGLAEENTETDLTEIRAFAYMNGELTDLRAENPEAELWDDKGELKWTGVRNKYFAAILIPHAQTHYRVELKAQMIDYEPFKSHHFSVGKRIGQEPWGNTVYLGPLDYERLAQYDVELERSMDLGIPIIRDISKFLLIFFVYLYTFIPNYGWVIIVFATVVKIVFYPLTHKTYESAARMQELQPKITALRDKYKNDQQRLSRETMKLYKDEGVNPLGGCLPMLPQMPIFFALYQVFSSAIELRQTPFLWITDLSQPDTVMVGGFALHLLPLLMAASMFIQQKMTMKDPKQAFLVYLMPVMMIFFFWGISSGLVLYWTTFNVLTIAQQWLVNHFKKTPQPAVAPVVKRK